MLATKRCSSTMQGTQKHGTASKANITSVARLNCSAETHEHSIVNIGAGITLSGKLQSTAMPWQ
jgi:hypothetical protein